MKRTIVKGKNIGDLVDRLRRTGVYEGQSGDVYELCVEAADSLEDISNTLREALELIIENHKTMRRYSKLVHAYQDRIGAVDESDIEA